MLDFLRQLFLPSVQMKHVSMITGYVAEIIDLFDQEYTVDKDAKNAAIDSVIQLLEDHKDKPVKK